MKRNVKPCWTEETFKKLLKKRVPAPCLVFVNFYIRVLWTRNKKFLYPVLTDINDMPWNQNLDSNEFDKWFPHVVIYNYSSYNHDCFGCCPLNRLEIDIWRSLYNRLFQEAFLDPWVEVDKIDAEHDLSIYSNLMQSMKYHIEKIPSLIGLLIF